MVISDNGTKCPPLPRVLMYGMVPLSRTWGPNAQKKKKKLKARLSHHFNSFSSTVILELDRLFVNPHGAGGGGRKVKRALR